MNLAYFFLKKTFVTAFTDIDFLFKIFARVNFILYGTVLFSKEYFVLFNLLNYAIT